MSSQPPLPSEFPPTCQCRVEDAPLFCERHGVQKGPRWVKLCQTNEKYYTAWEEGRGPSQNTMTSGEGRPTRVNKFGPGSVLTRMLKRCGLKYTLNCKCKKRAHQMDLWGPDGCEENMDTILGWLKEEAEKRNLPFARTAAKLLVKEAIRRSRKKLASVEHVTA